MLSKKEQEKLKKEFLNVLQDNSEESLSGFAYNLKKTIESKKALYFELNADSDFLITEIRKIVFNIQDYINNYRREFVNVLVEDIINLCFIIIKSKNKLSENEIFFMTSILLLIHQDTELSGKEKLCSILNDFSGASDMAKVNKMWPKVEQLLPKHVDKNNLPLPSLDCLKRYDDENGTMHYEKMRTIFFTFIQSLMKIDGHITENEVKTEKLINKILFSKKPFSRDKIISLGSSEEEGVNSSEIVAAVEGIEEDFESVLKKIDEMVGLDNIKEEINTLINLIKIKKKRKERGLPNSKISLHSVFYGPPGTGKTTIARLLGKVFKYLGLLEKGHVVETDRAGLVAGFIGQTAIQVNKIAEAAMGGILFIDEAYALKGSGNDFGQEAIDTILKRMEDHRDKFVVIVAGYPDEMKEFIDSNPGLKSRFSRYFYFKDYNAIELVQIYKIFCKNTAINLTKAGEEKLLTMLKILYAKKGRSFGNGRLVRNIFEKSIGNQANRLVKISPLTDEILSTIKDADIPLENELYE